MGNNQVTGQVTTMVPVEKEDVSGPRAIGKVRTLLNQMRYLGHPTDGGQGVAEPIMAVQTAIAMAGDEMVTKRIKGITTVGTWRKWDP